MDESPLPAACDAPSSRANAKQAAIRAADPGALRLWPAAVILLAAAILIPLGSLAVTLRHPDGPAWTLPLFLGPPLTGLLLLVWWMLASRLPWTLRFQGLGLMILGSALLMLAVHATMRQWVVQSALPLAATLAIVWTAATAGRSAKLRRRGMIVVVVLVGAAFLPFRFDGFSGGMVPALSFRWSRTPEDSAEDYARTRADISSTRPQTNATLVLTKGDWPEFRGPLRDGVVRDSRIRRNWNQDAPSLIWKHPVGLGWSSFAVVGNFAFTQEQRREDECVVCYDVETGDEIWSHADRTRFSEAMGGDGPRATPTFHDGKIYALGATGTLNCLDAATGDALWTTNILRDAAAENLPWGMAGSPLVSDDLVIVNPGGSDGKGLIAYHRLTGKPIWSGGSDAAGYSSPQVAILNGTRQILIFDHAGLAGHDAHTGAQLWKFPRRILAHNAIQPHRLNDSTLLIATSNRGTTQLQISQGAGSWSANEQWTSRQLKVSFNDLVTKDGYAYGLDEGILACIDLTDGTRKWKRGRYGYGQVLLVGELLLIQAESGEVALVEATPSGYQEIARFQAIRGKTWNHPVVAHGRLFVRNSQEAACYDVRPR